MKYRFLDVFSLAIGLLVTLTLAGCGDADVPAGPVLVPVTGQVSLGDQPLADADLTFFPIESTAGIGGKTRTNEAGQFDEVLYMRGGIGLPAGTYRVSVSKRVMPNGSPVPPDDETPAIESPAKELLPAVYSSPEQAKLQVQVQEGKPIELKLQKS